ncbi:MAG: AcrB/AcrD/AcrF family protein [Alteromonadaceae bacterium]|uniref:Acriflavin resistance protein n=1 Tax=Paraglaciecola agarilytica NO2 TaxID=1125747 RepID=A0ABQ0I537_9ALTE|nr:efflux RND transporter permease subunit [Paraglaciecola agarilytica]MBN28182.1 AcrB/AcrD/AcrF family protein [Alteromonadaceae bacterium]GAC04436.1 acriflavin resistance protein [Paraglaciecola agarilytica NO2]
MNLTLWAAKHRGSILFLVLLLALSGLFAATKLPVALFPHVNFPRVVVSIEAGDQPAEQMAITVTRKIEQTIRAVPGVVNLRSTTSRGSAEISVNFAWGDDMVSEMLLVDSALNQILPELPQGTKFTVKRMDPTVFPVAAYSLTSSTESLVTLRDIGEFQLVPLLSSINGVAKVVVVGGEKTEYRILISPEKLAALALTFTDVAQVITANNTLQAVGRLEEHYKLFLMLSDTRIQSLQTLKDTVIRSGVDGLVRLSDVADIEVTTSPQWTNVTADGKNAVLFQIYQQPAGNSVQIVDEVKSNISTFRDKLSKDIILSNWYDQSELITEAGKSVRDAISIGILLAALVLLVFLRNVKITLIAIVIVPAVLATTALLLSQLNMSFNIMTLGGMAAAVGLIVDDAIVMIEHVIRRLREEKGDTALTVRKAAIEFTKPLTGSSAATIIIFAPLAFLSGVTGAFFKALSMTMASSLVISFLLAWLAVPLIAEYLVSEKDAEKEDNGKIFKTVLSCYKKIMNRMFLKPWIAIIWILPMLLIGYYSYNKLGSGFMPQMDEGGFILDYVAPASTSLAETDRLLQQIEQIIQENPNVDTYSRRTGLQLGGGLTEANEGDFFIKLIGFPRPNIQVIMDDLRSVIELKVPGVEVEMALLMEDLIGDLTAVPQPIEIKLYGDDQQALFDTAPKIAKLISNIIGVVDIKDGLIPSGDSINITIDRDKAALEGVDPQYITQQLNTWFSGDITTQVQQGLKLIDVRLWIPVKNRKNIESIEKIWIQASDGHQFPLKRIATVTLSTGQMQISRDNLKRMVPVTARITGRDLGSTIAEIKSQIMQSGLLTKDQYYELGGLYKQQQIAFKGLIQVFISALALVFLLLLFLYEDFAIAIAIIVSPLLAMPAVFVGLWLTGIELNITAIMGMTMILGIVTEVSIFYFSEYQALCQQGMTQQNALLDAGLNRLRPITMTTIAAILALLPLALALGQGSAMQQPLAIAIIAGLLVQIPIVTIVTPTIYRTLSTVLK